MQGRRLTSLWAAMLGAWLAAGPAGAAGQQGAQAERDAQAAPPPHTAAETDATPLPQLRRRTPPAACST